jgi:AcrR family transcriptional regulator
MSSEQKREIIIKKALKLFAHKGYRSTTMQDVAEACGMSKGSLYIHFKSKDVLLFHILKTFYQTVDTIIIEVEQQYFSSEKEKLVRQIETFLLQTIAHRELFSLLHRERLESVSPEIEELIQDHNLGMLRFIERRLIETYGQVFSPYAFDTTMFIGGIISTHMNLILMEQAEFDLEHLSRYFVRSLDYQAEGVLRDLPPPLNLKEKWNMPGKPLSCTKEQPLHPLSAVKKLKELLVKLELSVCDKQEVTESLNVLENELTEIRPRKVILKGMIHNLESISSMHPYTEMLKESLKMKEYNL